MSSDFNLTETGKKILLETRDLLRPNLYDYLLSGLDGAHITHCHAVETQSTSPHSKNITYRFEMRNVSAQGLPIGHGHLVLAVILDMRLKRQPTQDIVTFRMRDILEVLQWPPSTETQMLIEQPVEKYVSIAYCLVTSTLPQEGSSLCTSFKRLLIGYETSSRLLPINRTVRQQVTSTHFLPTFINPIIPRENISLVLNLRNCGR